jgi:hypothetical protein
MIQKEFDRLRKRLSATLSEPGKEALFQEWLKD